MAVAHAHAHESGRIDDALEREGFSASQIASAITPKIQQLIILPTEKCNFRCTYCYEDFSIGKMSEATQLALEKFIDRRVGGLKELHFNWFGGEPLVAKDVVLRISRHAKRRCTEGGVRFVGAMTTNGYLLDAKLFNDLLDCNQDFFQITLDGFGATHDAVRRFIDGRGTFDVIWENLLAMKQSAKPFEVVIRVHVRRESIGELPVFMEKLGANFGSDKRFRLDFEHVRDLGGEGGKSVQQAVKLPELIEIEREMRKIFVSHIPGTETGERASEAAVYEALQTAKGAGESAGSQRANELLSGGHYICYASRPNSLLIRADGRIGKCTVALYDERNTIGCINTDGTITIDNSSLRPWIRGFENLDADTLGCPWKFMPESRNAERAASKTQIATKG